MEDFKLFLANQQCINQIKKMSRIREVKIRDDVIWHIGYVIPLINGRVIVLMTFIVLEKFQSRPKLNQNQQIDSKMIDSF